MEAVEVIMSDSFEHENHFYPEALNTQLHLMMSHLFNLVYKPIILDQSGQA